MYSIEKAVADFCRLRERQECGEICEDHIVGWWSSLEDRYGKYFAEAVWEDWQAAEDY